jgi:nitroreductase
MSKKANTIYNIHPLLNERWSPRAFENKEIESEKLQRIFEAARWSPSASNEQPWYFIIGQNNNSTYQKIFETLIEFNQLWTKFAPVLVISIGKSLTNKNEHNSSFKYDVGQSVAHLTFQAAHEGLFVHQMTGFDPAKAAELFEIPAGFVALSAMAIGYLGNPLMLHSRMQKTELAERERKNLNEFVFEEKFGQQSDLIE